MKLLYIDNHKGEIKSMIINDYNITDLFDVTIPDGCKCIFLPHNIVIGNFNEIKDTCKIIYKFDFINNYGFDQ